MRATGDVLLISCYELGHQPLSLASPLAYLRERGYQPVALDSSVQPVEPDQLRSARLLAISVPMHTALRIGVRIARRARSVNPSIHITFYGLYALLNSDHLLDTCADSVIGGEYEQPLAKLVDAIERGESYADVPGVVSASSQPKPFISKVPFAVPDRSYLPSLCSYAHLEDARGQVVAGYTETSRGCLHKCRHCPITPVYNGRFFVVPRDVVLADIRTQVEMGAQHITFGDPDFLNGPGHSLRVLREMHQQFPELTFDATIKIEHILEHREIFREFRELGCAFVLSAVESLSDEVLTRLDKGHTRADVEEAVRIMRDAGVALRPSLLPFTPWETLEGYVDILDFFENEGMIGNVDPVQFSIRLLVPPHSALVSELERSGLLGKLDAESYTYEWSHTDPRMDALQQQVSTAVEKAQYQGQAPAEIFQEIKRLAYDLAGRALSQDISLVGAVATVPRLTESWFC